MAPSTVVFFHFKVKFSLASLLKVSTIHTLNFSRDMPSDHAVWHNFCLPDWMFSQISWQTPLQIQPHKSWLTCAVNNFDGAIFAFKCEKSAYEWLKHKRHLLVRRRKQTSEHFFRRTCAIVKRQSNTNSNVHQETTTTEPGYWGQIFNYQGDLVVSLNFGIFLLYPLSMHKMYEPN